MDFCSVASGSSGNCIYVGTLDSAVLIDAGITGKRVSAGLQQIDRKPEDIDGILVTHEHSDHIQGLGVLARKYHIPIYCTKKTKDVMMGKQMIGKVDDALFHVICPDTDFQVKGLKIHPFKISHDAADPVGYRLTDGQKSVAVATDLGYYDNYIVENLKNLDSILIEANHDVNMLQVGAYPYYLKQRILGLRGHLSNENCGKLLGDILHDNMKSIMLGHLSKENNYEALALATVCAEITMGDNPYKASDFPIEIAKRDAPGELITV